MRACPFITSLLSASLISDDLSAGRLVLHLHHFLRLFRWHGSDWDGTADGSCVHFACADSTPNFIGHLASVDCCFSLHRTGSVSGVNRRNVSCGSFVRGSFAMIVPASSCRIPLRRLAYPSFGFPRCLAGCGPAHRGGVHLCRAQGRRWIARLAQVSPCSGAHVLTFDTQVHTLHAARASIVLSWGWFGITIGMDAACRSRCCRSLSLCARGTTRCYPRHARCCR